MTQFNAHRENPVSTGSPLFTRTLYWAQQCTQGLNLLSPAVSLLFRLWIAAIFWKAGMAKIASWDATLYLFTYEYSVPVLSPQLAAWLGTGVELLMPVLLAVGLATRFSALTLFLFNIIAVLSYPSLNEVGIQHHQYWGLMLLVPLFYGPGLVSLDALIHRYLRSRSAKPQDR
uniref:DoxX family protein n=1 Tax=Marinobacterium profundum TaxID=1714300 RepID=UPI0009E86C01|nr:DoxX family protein [Marinobacterium profundum]